VEGVTLELVSEGYSGEGNEAGGEEGYNPGEAIKANAATFLQIDRKTYDKLKE
jgi:hypothetical protein